MTKKLRSPWQKPKAGEAAEVTVPYEHGYGGKIYRVLFISTHTTEKTYRLTDGETVFDMYAAKCRVAKLVSGSQDRLAEVTKILGRRRS